MLRRAFERPEEDFAEADRLYLESRTLGRESFYGLNSRRMRVPRLFNEGTPSQNLLARVFQRHGYSAAAHFWLGDGAAAPGGHDRSQRLPRLKARARL